MAASGDFSDLIETRIAEQTHHHRAAFGHPSILGRDGGLAYPIFQAMDSFVVMFVDLRLDSFKIVRRRGGDMLSHGRGHGALKEAAAVHG